MNRKVFIILLTFVLLFIQRSDLWANNDYSADTTLVSKLYEECKGLIYNDPEAVTPKVDSMIVISERIDFNHGLYLAYNIMGIKWYMLGDYPASSKAYFRALHYVDKHDISQKIRIYTNLSYSYSHMGNSDSSLYYTVLINSLSKKHHLDKSYNQSLLDLGIFYMSKSDYVQTASYLMKVDSISKKSEDSMFILLSYSALAQFYQQLENFNKSYSYYYKAIELDKEFLDYNFLANNTLNLGQLFLRLKENYDTAVYFFNRSIELSLPYEKPENTLQAMINIGNVFLDKEDYDSSFYYYSKAYEDPLLETRPVYQAAIYTNLGIYYHGKGDYKKAKEFLTKGLSLSKELDLKVYKRNALNQLWVLEKSMNHHDLALQYHVEYLEVLQSIQEQDAINELAIIDYEKSLLSKKYANEILISENNQQQSQIILQRVIIIVVLILFSALLVFLYIIYQKKKEIKTLHEGLSRNYSAMENVNQVLKVQETEMKSMLANKDRFVSILGHDLKNPFSGLLGLLELMDSDWDEMEEKDKKDGIEMLYQSSVQTYQLLEDLLDWGKTQQGLIKSELDNIDLNALLKGVVSMFDIQSKKKNVSVLLDIPGGAQVYTDLKLSSQIIQNFIGNAIKYTHVGGEIFIKVDSEKKNYKINIIDHGIGIPANKIDSLFSLNSTFNRPGTENEKSTGMGLILCKEYAEIIGGELAVTSEEGKGSSFSLIIEKA